MPTAATRGIQIDTSSILHGEHKSAILSPEDLLMNTRKVVLGTVLSLGVFVSGIAIGQDINGRRHPHLAAAQRGIEEALGALQAAQNANEYDLHNHAANAKGYLDQAYREIKLAAEVSNQHGH
jgi:hypothetical protein